MRILHPTTIEILVSHFPKNKTHISHAWAEVFKWKGSGKSHPKMFIDDDVSLGAYLRCVYIAGLAIGCKFDKEKIKNLSKEVQEGFDTMITLPYFDSDYLFSDAVSLYFKGTNIFPYIFGDEWRRYVPVESLEEIKRQVIKTLNGKNNHK